MQLREVNNVQFTVNDGDQSDEQDQQSESSFAACVARTLERFAMGNKHQNGNSPPPPPSHSESIKK